MSVCVCGFPFLCGFSLQLPVVVCVYIQLCASLYSSYNMYIYNSIRILSLLSFKAVHVSYSLMLVCYTHDAFHLGVHYNRCPRGTNLKLIMMKVEMQHTRAMLGEKNLL